MGDVDGQGRREDPDELRFGPSRSAGIRLPGWLRNRRVAVVVALVLVAAAVAIAVAAGGHGHRRPVARRPVTEIVAGRRLLGVRAGWDLFATGPGVLVRIQPAAGLMTRTEVPALRSSGPVYFVVGPHQAIIRPLDFVPGYLVLDGRPARVLPPALGRAGQAFPGPRPGQLWVETGFGANLVMSLVDVTGRRVGASLTLPRPWGYIAVADGRGYLLVQDGGTIYDFRPARRWRVSSGTLDAVGPSAWLITRCSRARCRYTVIDPADGDRRMLPGRAARTAGPFGVISPTGRIAAVVRYGPRHSLTVHLLNLVTGVDRRLSVIISGATSTLAWTPDGRWLLAVTANGTLIAIDPRTGRADRLDAALPAVSQLAIRAAS